MAQCRIGVNKVVSALVSGYVNEPNVVVSDYAWHLPSNGTDTFWSQNILSGPPPQSIVVFLFGQVQLFCQKLFGHNFFGQEKVFGKTAWNVNVSRCLCVFHLHCYRVSEC